MIVSLLQYRVFIRDKYGNAKDPTLAWYQHALKADWSVPSNVKQDLWNACKVVYTRFIGTHGEYDNIDVQIMVIRN